MLTLSRGANQAEARCFGRLSKRHLVVLPVVAVVVGLAACTPPPPSSTARTAIASGTGPPAPIGELPAAAAAIMAKPEYKSARWIYSVVDPQTGEVVLANRPDELVFTASTAKNFTVGSVYATAGPDATLTTPVYATAPAVDGRVDGDLVLVASGDLALGGRGAMEGRVDQAFTATTIDHVYGDVAPNAALVPDDPLAGLEDLARQVKESGITSVGGDVVIDTRIWNTFGGQEGPVPSIFVNDNILDITVKGGAAGEPATLDLRPETSAITVTSTVRTSDAGTPTALRVTPSASDPSAITVSGTIGAGASQLTIYRVPDAPTWARTLFIEALRRAGVSVTAPAIGPNDEAALPPKDSFRAEQKVASITSPPLEAFGTMILKTSYNTGANAMMCLLAARAGSADCVDGLTTMHEQIDKAGLVADDVLLFDGQGADPASTTPAQMAAWMRWAQTQPWGAALVAGQPVLGVDGTLASTGQSSPAKGKVAAKTGTSVAIDPITQRVYFKVQSMAGYLTTDQGRNLVFALSMSGATYPDLATGLHDANEDVAAVAAAFQQAFSAAPLPTSITGVMNKPRYANAKWSLLVTDVATGESWYGLNTDQMSLTGSTRKLFSVGAALDALGPDRRQTTPVYRQGTVTDGVLDGNLILVGGGDLAFGGRRVDADTIQYTDFDHNDANGLGTAILTPQDPLYAVNDLARQVKAAGVTSVNGDVVVDSRLFEPYRVPNGNLLITPTMLNENMVDVTVTPAATAGQAATMAYRPRTAALAVNGHVDTVAAGTAATKVTLSDGARPTCLATPGCTATVSGEIPVGYKAPLTGSDSFVGTFRVEDPDTFVRTAFIEALARNGVTVTAPAVAPNDASKLSEKVMPGSYAPDTQVATYQSAPYSQTAQLVLKVSLNLGANLSLSLLGVSEGERTVQGALAVERKIVTTKYGVDGAQFDFPTNGSGTPDSKASPRALVQMLTAMHKTSVAAQYLAALPVLGENGSLATVGRTLPARGHVFAKPGTTISADANGVPQLEAQNLAGYINTKSGRTVAYALMVNDAGPLPNFESDISEVFEDEATISSAIYESL